MPAPEIPVGYLTPREASRYLSISIKELERLRRTGGGPVFCKPSYKVVRYAIADLNEWMARHAFANTAEAAERGSTR